MPGSPESLTRSLGPTIGSPVSHETDTTAGVLPGDAPPPFSRHFFQKGDAQMAVARKIYFKAIVVGTFMTVVTMFAVFSIYWGSLWKVPVKPLGGWIVDFDGGVVGQNVSQALLASSNAAVTWVVVPADQFPGGTAQVIEAVLDNRAWVVVTINLDATARLEGALSTPNPSYNGSEAMTMYGIEARNENAYRVFIRPTTQTALDEIRLSFATQLAAYTASSPKLSSIMSSSPQTIVAPISYTIVNLIPFNQPVASAATFVGLIYLLILSFFLVMIANGAREASGINRLLTFRSLVTVRLVSSLVGYFFLSVFYTTLNLAFNLKLRRKYGPGGVVIFWMLNWVGMLSVGLALEVMITLMTAQYIPFFLILWIIANVSVCIFPLEILPKIYHYGYAGPFYNISQSVRSIAFGTKDTLGLNFGVLLAWVVISCIALPLFQFLVRRKEVGAAQQRSLGEPEKGSKSIRLLRSKRSDESE